MKNLLKFLYYFGLVSLILFNFSSCKDDSDGAVIEFQMNSFKQEINLPAKYGTIFNQIEVFDLDGNQVCISKRDYVHKYSGLQEIMDGYYIIGKSDTRKLRRGRKYQLCVYPNNNHPESFEFEFK